MENVPKKIYLNIDDDATSETSDFNELFSKAVTWSEDRINDADVEFVRAPKPTKIKVFKGIEQGLAEVIGDYLDSESVELYQAVGRFEDPEPRSETNLHTKMAWAAMQEYIRKVKHINR